MSDQTTPKGDQVPSTIGRFQITGPLGFGAMGAVYKAFDPMIKRTLAIKTIRLDVPKGSPQHKAFIERFYQEARISGTLSHPGIVTLFDIGEEGGIPFLAMEFIDGKTIAAVIEQGTRFKPEKVIGLVSQVAAALDYAHSRGVVHRDIKPSNLMLFDNEKVKVTDFGIAKLADAEITHAGALLGTPSYMSPEQAMGEKLDGRSDIFSLGVCAFEMLSGQQPFPGANVTSILYKLVHVEPVEPADLEANGLVPQKWREVFHKVLAKKPANRYQTASAFVRDLEYCLGSWFTGLGEETISLASPAAAADEERTVTMAMPALHAPSVPAGPVPAPVPRPAAVEHEIETVLHAPAVQADEGEATVVMKAVDAGEPATLRMAAPSALEDLVPATVQLPVLPESPTSPPPLPATAERPAFVTGDTLREAVAATASGALPASEPARARPGLPVALVLGVAAVLLLAVAGLLGWLLLHRAPSGVPAPEASLAPTAAPESGPSVAATPTPTPQAVLGSLHVESEPAGAVVKLNGEARGRTPLDLGELPLGDYEVRVEQRGYEAQTQRVSLAPETPAAQLKATLSRSAPVTGAADIVSTPPGATVAVDGRPTGRTTPLNALSLKPGARRLELTLAGHEPWTGSLDVVAGQKGRVEVRLRPLVVAKPTPTPPPAVDAARVYPEAEVDVKPRKLSGNSPEYPRDRAPRLRSGERVSVTVQFQVTETGEVQDVKVLESGGKMVDDVVVNAIRTWRFQPATKHGIAVKSLTAFRQTFLGG